MAKPQDCCGHLGLPVVLYSLRISTWRSFTLSRHSLTDSSLHTSRGSSARVFPYASPAASTSLAFFFRSRMVAMTKRTRRRSRRWVVRHSPPGEGTCLWLTVHWHKHRWHIHRDRKNRHRPNLSVETHTHTLAEIANEVRRLPLPPSFNNRQLNFEPASTLTYIPPDESITKSPSTQASLESFPCLQCGTAVHNAITCCKQQLNQTLIYPAVLHR